MKRCGFSHLRVPDLVIDKVNELHYELLHVIKAVISLKWVLEGHLRWYLYSFPTAAQNFTLNLRAVKQKNHLLSLTFSVSQ